MGLTAVRAQGVESPLPLAEYWRRAEQTLDLVELISDLPAEEQRLALQFEADRWQHTMGVTLSDGSQLDLNHSYLVSTLRACRSPIHSPDLNWARNATGAPSAKSLPVSTEPELEP